jgi:hypothetical protein
MTPNGRIVADFEFTGVSAPPKPPECACQKILGVGQVTVPVDTAVSPWTVAVTTSVVSAMTGWMLEEIVQHVRRRTRR